MKVILCSSNINLITFKLIGTIMDLVEKVDIFLRQENTAFEAVNLINKINRNHKDVTFIYCIRLSRFPSTPL